MEIYAALIGAVIVFGAALGIFLAIRAVMLWYWRVDEQIALLRDIRDSLKTLSVEVPAAPTTPAAASAPVEIEHVRVPASIKWPE